MNKSLTSKVLLPGYGVIILGSVVENLIFHLNWFKLGSVFGLLWLLIGMVGLLLALRELKKSDGYMLVQSGPYAVSRNPVVASNLLGIMPGLCLLLNTNIGILGIAAAAYLFYKNVHDEEDVLENAFGEDYQSYRERVSRLMPCPFSSDM